MKVVVVHSGARDGYQVACALKERGALDTLVTDLYWPAERRWARALESAVPASWRDQLRRRWAGQGLSGHVASCWWSGLLSFGSSKLAGIPFAWNRWAMRWSDHRLGRAAGKHATAQAAGLLSYSYYAYSAFTNYTGQGPRILFQLHPHPARVREILDRERRLNPECAESLSKEWELALPPADFQRLVDEIPLADHWIVASTFTRQTLIENGIPRDRIHLAPYGADLRRFTPNPLKASHGRLRLLFVGSINQRKGIKYLLDAMDRLPADRVELTICGRVVDGLNLFQTRRPNVTVRASVSNDELIEAYQGADVFVFPSLAEGFGHVLLEAMACGLPVIATTRTAAIDLVTEGREGFVVEPARPDQLVERVEWFLAHPSRVAEMGEAARRRAQEFTWHRFREQIGAIVAEIAAPSTRAAHV